MPPPAPLQGNTHPHTNASLTVSHFNSFTEGSRQASVVRGGGVLTPLTAKENEVVGGGGVRGEVETGGRMAGGYRTLSVCVFHNGKGAGGWRGGGGESHKRWRRLISTPSGHPRGGPN